MTLLYQRSRQRVLRRRNYTEGVLGNGSGSVYAGKSRYWVRLASQTDDNGNVTYGTALPIRYAAASSIMPIEGVEVLLQVDYDNELSIIRVKPDYFERADIDSRASNQAEPHDQFVYLKNVVRELTRPVGSASSTDSTLITIREDPFIVNDYLDWSIYAGTPRAADKPDLASYIPAADLQRLVCVFLDSFQNDYFITASTAQVLTVDIDSTDWDECFAQLKHNEYKPLLALKLSNAQTAITVNDIVEDLRQHVNTPQIIGFANPIVSGKAIYIRETHQEITANLVVEGCLTVEGTMIVL